MLSCEINHSEMLTSVVVINGTDIAIMDIVFLTMFKATCDIYAWAVVDVFCQIVGNDFDPIVWSRDILEIILQRLPLPPDCFFFPCSAFSDNSSSIMSPAKLLKKFQRHLVSEVISDNRFRLIWEPKLVRLSLHRFRSLLISLSCEWLLLPVWLYVITLHTLYHSNISVSFDPFHFVCNQIRRRFPFI